METLIKQIYAQAKLLGCCEKFKGTEDLQGIIRLFTSPQGIEFCMKNHFPNISTLRLFKAYNVEKYGIYIDAGNTTLVNPRRAIVIGRTTLNLTCDTLERHELVLLRGARAVINASKWAVVFVRSEHGCSCIKNTTDNALIL